MKRNIFIFDQNKCVGCQACIVACLNENGYQSPETWRSVYSSSPQHHPEEPFFWLSMACNHCTDAPCLSACPAKAFTRDHKTGAVIHDPDKCLGCKYCTWVCPFNAPVFNQNKGIIEKCTFCNENLKNNLPPACANNCPTGALSFSRENLSREQARDSSPVPVNINPSLKIIKPENPGKPVMDTEIFFLPHKNTSQPSITKKISAAKEWPLLIFSLLSAFMVSLYVLRLYTSFPEKISAIILSGGFFSALISFFHLGNKRKAWKVLNNLSSSWLSREILGFILFYSLTGIQLITGKIPESIILITGATFLFSVDRIYYPATWKWKIKIHSAQILFISLGYALLITQNGLFFSLLIFLRIIIFLIHHKWKDLTYSFQKQLFILRLILPIMSIYCLYFIGILWPVFLFTAFADLADRIFFYNHLKVPGPENESYPY